MGQGISAHGAGIQGHCGPWCLGSGPPSGSMVSAAHSRGSAVERQRFLYVYLQGKTNHMPSFLTGNHRCPFPALRQSSAAPEYPEEGSLGNGVPLERNTWPSVPVLYQDPLIHSSFFLGALPLFTCLCFQFSPWHEPAHSTPTPTTPQPSHSLSELPYGFAE